MARDPISQKHLAEIRIKTLSRQYNEVADLVAENAKLKALLSVNGIALDTPAPTPVEQPAKFVPETIEPESTPLETPPDESEAGEWESKPEPEPSKKTAKKK